MSNLCEQTESFWVSFAEHYGSTAIWLEVHDFSTLFALKALREIEDSSMSSTIETFGSTRLVQDGSFFSLSKWRGGGSAELYRGACCGGSIWPMGADWRGADGERV
jgi:hypothetical protein